MLIVSSNPALAEHSTEAATGCTNKAHQPQFATLAKTKGDTVLVTGPQIPVSLARHADCTAASAVCMLGREHLVCSCKPSPEACSSKILALLQRLPAASKSGAGTMIAASAVDGAHSFEKAKEC